MLEIDFQAEHERRGARTMGWDISSVKVEETFYFERAIPKQADTWVKIATTTPLVDRAIEQFLAGAILRYGEDGITNEWTKNWEQLKNIACSATFLECNFTRDGKPIFPKRARISEPLGKGNEFTDAWSELRPSSITDEWMGFFFKANPEWFNRLNDLWIAKDWKDRWMGDWEPETLGEGSKD